MATTLPATTRTSDAVSHVLPDLPDSIADLLDDAAGYVEASRAPNTRRGYRSDFRQVGRWFVDHGLPVDVDDDGDPVPMLPIDPRVVAAYVGDRAKRGLKPATLSRHLSAITHWHKRAGWPSPCHHPQVETYMDGIRREHRTDRRQASPLFLRDVHAMVDGLDGTVKDTRDRALLLLGWWTAARRSELADLEVADLEKHRQGMVVRIRRSKTSQTAAQVIPVHCRKDEAHCPVRATRRWLKAAKIGDGPVLRGVTRWGTVLAGGMNPQSISDLVKEHAGRIGLDPARYSAHSLRSGFVSECDERQIPSTAVRLVTRHRTEAMLAVYNRRTSLFTSAAGHYFSD